MKSRTYEPCRYFVPSSLLASQTTKTTANARRRALKPEPLTYAVLLSNQTQLVTLGQLNAQTAANRATALRQFLRASHLQIDDVVGLEMRPHFPLAFDRLAVSLREEGRSDRSISNTRSALTAWKQHVIADDTARALLQSQPTPFLGALKKTVEGHAIKRVASQTGVPLDMLHGWLKGKIPRASNAMYIRRLEGFFGLERESLVTMAGIVGSTRAREQVGVPNEIEYRKLLGARSKSEYYLEPPVDSPLRAQWAALMQYKTALIPPLRRSPSGRWTFAPQAVMTARAANWWGFIDGVEVPTAKTAWAKTASYLGWLSLPLERGGRAIPEDDLQTLGWMVIPDYIEEYVEWLKKRCGGKLSKSIPEYLNMFGWMVRPGNGYLYQQPDFLNTLPAEFHREDWRLMCERQHDYLAQLKQAYGPSLESSRDPFEPIRQIIQLPQPLEAIADMTQRMRRDRPVGGSAVNEAVWARDILMVRLLVSNPLRLRNIATLTWSKDNVEGRRPDNKGCLYQQGDGTWWIFVPKKLLKNRRGTAIHDYDSPVHASVRSDLERYLLRHRNDLIRWTTDLVFLARTRDPARTETTHDGEYKTPPPTCHLPFMSMSVRIFELTRKYLWKSAGIGTHAFRHLVVTAILKTHDGDIKTASLVLNDSEATVAKHYSGMRSGDGATRMGELLGKTLNRM